MLDVLIAVALGILTLVTAYLGMHVTLNPADTPEKKSAYRTAFALCALGACGLIFWQAYRNHMTQEQLAAQIGRIESNTKTPPTVEVNVPPAQVVIEQPPGVAKSPLGFLQVTDIKAAIDNPTVMAGKQVSINVYFQEMGSGPVENIQNFETLSVAAEADEAHLKKEFHRHIADLIQKSRGIGVSSASTNFYNSAVSPVLTEEQATGILDGSQRLYLLVWASWKSGESNGKLEQCSWVLKPSSPNLAYSPITMRSCEVK
jgi:hypothetical protein